MRIGPFINAPFDILYERFNQLQERGLMPEIYFDGNMLDTFVLKEYKSVANRLKESGIPCNFHAPYEDICPASFDNKIREISEKRLLDTCQIADLFHPQVIVCHTGYWKWIHYERQDAWLERSIESWTKVSEAAQKNGTRILLENVFDDSPEILERLIQEIGHNKLGICLDIGHLTIFTKYPLKEWLDVLGPYIEELHLHDNHGVFDEHLVMGRGTIDFDPLFQYIKEHGIRPIYTLEQHREEDIEPNLLALHALRDKFGL